MKISTKMKYCLFFKNFDKILKRTGIWKDLLERSIKSSEWIFSFVLQKVCLLLRITSGKMIKSYYTIK